MVNFGFGAASILGIFLAVAGAALYFLRSVRPELSRDHDIFFAAIGLLCGFILLFQGWRLDPILQFGQLLLSGTTVFFAVESIRLRSVATEQAKRNTPIVDNERPVSRVYRAELDELEPLDDERPMRRQIPGTRDTRSNRTDEYDQEAPRRRYRTDDYDDEPRRPASSRSSSGQRLGQGDRVRKRTSRTVSRSTARLDDDEWGSPKGSDDEWDDSGSGISRPSRATNGSSGSESREPDVSSRSRPRKRSRPPQNDREQPRSDESVTPTDYVDYQPIDHSDEESDNSANFDDR